ncbi:hypothetical protein ABMA27_015378 [Loxostege sticticalis]|uniref:Uncharacterized protein n=1 Tax=Loxostege sticticalis TaxID=481309 RepID=A0ABR3I7E4_LOXSC
MLFLMCISILFTVANVSSSEVKGDNHYNVKRVVRDIYEYNHPPSVLSVPVAIIHDEGSRQDRSEKPDVSITKSDETMEATTSTETTTNTVTTTVATTSTETTTNTVTTTETTTSTESTTHAVTTSEATTSTELPINKVLKGQFSINDELKTEPHSENGYIIPVAVIYDEDPKILQSSPKKHIKSESDRQQRRKVVKNASQDDIKEETARTSQDKTAITKFPKRTQDREPIVPILQSDNYVFSNSGDFHYSYEGGDGTKAFMKGELRSFDDDNAGTAVEGSFSYTGKDGNDYSLTYTADENGYRPIGAHLPTPPPIPPAIARALKYLATKTTPQPVTESL